MDNRDDIRDFLATRRAKLTPADVGLPTSARLWVPGLRREEVAVLAGVSTESYTKLEKGHIAGVSEEVLAAVADALRLDVIGVNALGRALHAPMFDSPTARGGGRTSRATTSWTPVLGSSSSTGRAVPSRLSRYCGPRRGLRRTTWRCGS